MKMIQALIREDRFPFVKRELEKSGIFGMNAREVSGRGEQGGIHLKFRGGILDVDLLPKLKLEIIVHDRFENTVVDAIKKSAYTGKPGDGRIFIIPVEESIRIRTNDVEV